MKDLGYMLGGMDLLTQTAETQKTNMYWTLLYIRRGIGMYILDSDLRPINQGDVIVLPPKLAYSFCSKDLGDEYNINVDAVVLRFDNAWLTNLLSVFGSMNRVVLKLREMKNPYAVEGPKWMKLSALMSELSTANPSRKAVLVIEILDLISSPKDMLQILHTTPVLDVSSAEKLQMIDRYINTNILTKISLEEVASYLGMNRTYFCMFFKKHYGKGFSDYLNDLRIEKAASLLLKGDRSIAEIARECGYKTVPYFNRAFKRSKGETPGVYRKKCQSL
jgi:AraC-like DNA-binding protein